MTESNPANLIILPLPQATTLSFDYCKTFECGVARQTSHSAWCESQLRHNYELLRIFVPAEPTNCSRIFKEILDESYLGVVELINLQSFLIILNLKLIPQLRNHPTKIIYPLQSLI